MTDVRPHSHVLSRFALAASVALLFVFSPAPASAVGDLSEDHDTLRTPHFLVHYESDLEPLARRVARIAEEAHEMMAPLLEIPPERTHVVINDRVDTANGSANVIGRNIIRVFAMPPTPDSVLGYYNDYLRILIYHEYAHILHLDTTGGGVEFINSLVGGIVHPNLILPRWYIEGQAVMFESKMTGTGRTYSSLFRMWLRTAALENEFFSIGTVSGSPISWPQGSTPYLYGGFFIQYVVQEYGVEFLRDFNKLYGRRIVPFALNSLSREVSGRTFHDLWREWEAYEKGKAVATHVAVGARGRTPLEMITDGGGRRGHPRRRPGTDQITFYHNELNDHAQFAATATANRNQWRLFEVDSAAGTSAWTPDGEALVYSRGTVKNSVYTYHDLYVWDADRDRTTRLTHDERARDPAISPDGDQIAYVRVQPGTTDLVVCDYFRLSVRNCEVVVGGSLHDSDEQLRWQQASTPVWAPDGERLVFSWWRLDEKRRDLWVARPSAPKGERLTRLTDDQAQDTAPHFGPDGLLYWSNDRTGIFNIYARRLDGEQVWQVSDVDTGAFQPCVSRDGRWIYAVGYTSEGYELTRFARPSRLWNEAPTSHRPDPRPDPPEIDESEWENGNYFGPRYLRPLVVKPDFGAASSGAGIGATVVGRAPVGYHDWALSGAILSGAESTGPRGNINLDYQWSGGPVNLNLSGSIRDNPRTRSLYAGSEFIPYVRRQYAASLGASLPIRRIDDSLTLSSSFRLDRSTFRDRPDTRHEPADRQPREPNHGWFNQLNFSLVYANLDRFPQSVSISRGVLGHFSLHVQDELLGADYESIFFTYGMRLYHPNPLLKRHILSLRFNGGIARSELGGGRAFAIGGYRPQDVLSSVIFQDPRGQFVLRGYPPATLVGSQYQVWSAGYRFPILRLDHGFSTVPIYLSRLKGEVFSDSGGAANGLLANADLRTSVGAQLQLGLQFGYYLSGSLRLGWARGFGEDGIDEWFLMYGGGF